MDMLFRERNNMHIEKVCTDKIDKDMYALLINVCDNLRYKKGDTEQNSVPPYHFILN